MSQSPPDNSFDFICPECGYDLRGIESDRCPECGGEFDRATASVSRVPWAHRASIGAVRAYWRTLLMATFQPTKLGRACATPVSFDDARRFRWLTVTIASVAVGGFFLFSLYDSGGTGGLWKIPTNIVSELQKLRPSAMTLVLPFYAGYLLWPTVLICTLVFFGLTSGVIPVWFDRQSDLTLRRNRAVALALYCSAPLAWIALPALLVGVHIFCVNQKWIDEHTPLTAIVVFTVPILLVAIGLAMWTTSIKVLHLAVQPRTRKRAMASMGLPLSWITVAIVSFLVMPWAIGLIWIMIDSLL